MKPITVIVADDDPIVREGLVAILESQPDIEVAGEVGDGQAAIELARQRRPDVMLMDIDMPQLNGLEATRQIKQQTPAVAIIIFTVYAHYLMDALSAGSSRYLLKGCPTQELLGAIRECAGGCVARKT